MSRTQTARRPLAGSDLYDDRVFFTRYQQMRDAGQGLNEALEQPALRRLLPSVQGADVVELGCGDGTLARRLAAGLSLTGLDEPQPDPGVAARWPRLAAHRHRPPLLLISAVKAGQ